MNLCILTRSHWVSLNYHKLTDTQELLGTVYKCVLGFSRSMTEFLLSLHPPHPSPDPPLAPRICAAGLASESLGAIRTSSFICSEISSRLKRLFLKVRLQVVMDGVCACLCVCVCVERGGVLPNNGDILVLDLLEGKRSNVT